MFVNENNNYYNTIVSSRIKQNEVDYQKLEMPPHIRGEHKFSHSQKLYADIHNFMTQREWAYAHPEGNASGVTWIEMFALFDTAAYRTNGAQHIRNEEAHKRAIRRRDKAKAAKAKSDEREIDTKGKRNWNIINTSAMTKASLDQEIKLFKAIVRQIARHELNDEQTRFFHMERRAHLRRLAPLGIEENEPAATAYCKVTPEEEATIIEAILQQKVGANAKNFKQYADFQEAKKQDLTDGNHENMSLLS